MCIYIRLGKECEKWRALAFYFNGFIFFNIETFAGESGDGRNNVIEREEACSVKKSKTGQ